MWLGGKVDKGEVCMCMKCLLYESVVMDLSRCGV